jgi:hypothetical protein
MKRLYARFPGWTFQREDVSALHADWDDPVLALIAAMVWGGIDTRTNRRLQHVLQVGESDLEGRMVRIRGLVKEGKVKEAFLSCSGDGENRIPGIGMSYFTKIFYFLGEVEPNLTPKPLILDKWTSNAFFALYGQIAGASKLGNMFSFPSPERLKRTRSILLKGDINQRAENYCLYIRLMSEWARRLGVTPSKLEEFVFGVDLRKDKSAANPRNEILGIAKRLIGYT